MINHHLQSLVQAIISKDIDGAKDSFHNYSSEKMSRLVNDNSNHSNTTTPQLNTNMSSDV
jgi:hypothetical protein